MIVLDHNVPRSEAEKLRRWRLRFEQIGFEVGRPEWLDHQEILRFLHSKKGPTFFTRDLGFFKARMRHANYCIVVVANSIEQTAATIRRFLRQPRFRSKAKRLGCIVNLTSARIVLWSLGHRQQRRVEWQR